MKTQAAVTRIKGEVAKAILGQELVIDQVLMAILAGGHALIEGVPGTAKTLLIRTLARTMSLDFNRIQFTPDLMPSDCVGTNVFDPRNASFALRQGPVFTQILLADEINRTPPKTQAALLEAMEERQVTIDGETHRLPFPFLVFATQNPIEFEGTYPLPEAQQDRFLIKILIDYPGKAAETEMLRRYHAGFRSRDLQGADIQPQINPDELRDIHAEVNSVRMEEKMVDYVFNLVNATRESDELQMGASPRAGLALVSCGQAVAAMLGRDFLIPDDIKWVAPSVLRHRVSLRADIDTQGVAVDDVLKEIIDSVPIPR